MLHSLRLCSQGIASTTKKFEIWTRSDYLLGKQFYHNSFTSTHVNMHILPSLVLVSFLLLLLPRLTHSFADPGTRPSTTCDAKRSTDPNDPGNPCSLRGDQLRGRHINITFTEIEYFMQFNRDKADTTSDPKGRLIFEDEATGLLFRSSPVMSTYAVGTAGGYLNDMIGWIADHAGFTYSAYIASGRCNNIDTKRPWHSDYAGEYVEGQKDVYNINCTNKFPNDPQKGRTDAYIGMYFITNGRHTLNDFTLPFLSNKGLSIGMLATEKGTILQRLAKQDSSDGTCQAIIAPDTNLEAAENRWIHEGEQTTMKRVIDTSWQYGYKEHAIGVRKDFPELTDTLNYWIHELSLAATATDNPLSLTYVGNNIDEMFRKAVGEKTVALGESYSLGVENFLGPIFVAFGLGLFVTIVSCWNHRDLFAYRTRFFGISPNAPLSIHKFLKTHHKECINEDGTMRMQRMMLKVRTIACRACQFRCCFSTPLLRLALLVTVPRQPLQLRIPENSYRGAPQLLRAYGCARLSLDKAYAQLARVAP